MKYFTTIRVQFSGSAVAAQSCMRKRLLPLCCFILLLSCNKHDVTPSWLKIDSFNLTTDVPSEGENSHGITDAWIYMDGQALGVHELPCVVPIIDEGSHSFTIYAGIKQNGISATRLKYPHYQSWKGDVMLVKNDTIELTPDITYKSGLTFSLMEDFEDAGIDLVPDAITDTPVVFIDAATYPSIVQWGSKCGGIFLTPTDSLFKAATSLNMNLPGGGANVFLEIDYMNTNSIAMGVIAENSSDINEHGLLVLMNRQTPGAEKWKKIYINLTEDVSYEINATSFEVYFLALLDDDNTSEGFIYLDNIKIVHP